MAQNGPAKDSLLLEAALYDTKRQLGAKRYEKTVETGTLANLLVEVEKLKQDYATRTVPKVLSRIDAFLQTLGSFVGAIDNIAQAGAPFVPLAWGILRVILTLAVRYNGCLDRIVDMLEEIGRRMPRFETYRNLLGAHNERLETRLAELYRHYMKFCVLTVRFFRRRPIYTLIKITWSREERLFEQALNRIGKCETEIEYEVNATNMRLGRIRHEELVSLLCPPSYSQKQSPRSLFIVPLSKNPKFYPRPDYIERMEKVLLPSPETDTTSQRQLRSIILHGVGGVGKTQLALHYAHENRNNYDAILWVSADTSAKLAEEYARLAKALDLSESEDQTKARDALLEWLAQTPYKNWLLILDNANANDPELLKSYWPRTSHGSVLVTSRNPYLEHGITSAGLSVEVLDTCDGSSMLLSLLKPKKLDQKQKQVAKEIVEELEGFPLAICQMAGYMLETGCPMERFLKTYRERGAPEALSDNRSSLHTFQYNHTLKSVWSLSLNSLTDQARQLIHICAFLDPDEIPKSLFLDGVAKLPELAFLGSTVGFDKAIGSLLGHSLLKRNDPSSKMSLHRLVQQSALQNLNISDKTNIFCKAASLLYHVFPRQSPLGEPIPDWDSCKRYTKHVLALYRGYEEYIPPKLDKQVLCILTELFCDCGVYLWARGLMDQSEMLAKISIKIGNAVLGEYDTLRAQPYTLLGCICLRVEGRLEEALQALQIAVEIRKTHKRIVYANSQPPMEDDVQLANAYSNLAIAFKQDRRYEESARLHEECIEVKRKWPEDKMAWLLALSYDNLGKVRRLQGRYDDAAALFRRGLSLKRDGQEWTTHRIAFFMSSLGSVEVERGNLEEAKGHFMEALRMLQDTVGDHLDTGLICYNLGSIMHQENDLESAKLLVQRSIEIFSQKQHHSPAKLARSKFRMSLILAKLGDHSASKSLKKGAYELRKCDMDDPKTGKSEEEQLRSFEALVLTD